MKPVEPWPWEPETMTHLEIYWAVSGILVALAGVIVVCIGVAHRRSPITRKGYVLLVLSVVLNTAAYLRVSFEGLQTW